jgi:hypothetical protein
MKPPPAEIVNTGVGEEPKQLPAKYNARRVSDFCNPLVRSHTSNSGSLYCKRVQSRPLGFNLKSASCLFMVISPRSFDAKMQYWCPQKRKYGDAVHSGIIALA